MKNKKIVILFFILLINIISYCFIKKYFYKNSVNNIFINDKDKIIILLKDNTKTYCSLDNINWVLSNNSMCSFDFNENNKYIFLKNKYGYKIKLYNRYNLSSIKEFNIKNNKIYLAIGGNEKIDYYLDSITNKDDKISFRSLDNDIATVDEFGKVFGNSVGNTKILIELENYSFEVNVIVTDLIVNKPSDYNYKKEYISCNEFSEFDNDLVDEILLNRINKVGISTRASVVEAARFMTMEFSRRIPYFAENGRLTMNNIDAEGRYYKSGMFLNESRYKYIDKSMHGPKSWGCNMYSFPVDRVIPNGLDCSGFVSWAFINGGFEVGDIGAGITPVKDFTDLGKKINIKTSIENNKIIVGDLLSGKFANGGHIAIVIGINNGYYYIAESLYEDNHTYYGVIARKYSFNELSNYFSWHIDMTDLYKIDGILTDYWIN